MSRSTSLGVRVVPPAYGVLWVYKALGMPGQMMLFQPSARTLGMEKEGADISLGFAMEANDARRIQDF